jgi:hypothetical protein
MPASTFVTSNVADVRSTIAEPGSQRWRNTTMMLLFNIYAAQVRCGKTSQSMLLETWIWGNMPRFTH